MQFSLLLTMLIASSLACCPSAESEKPISTPAALIIDGFCVNNRSARAPTAYYSSDEGKAQVRTYASKAELEIPMFKLAPEQMAKIREIAFSIENKVEAGKVNFFVRFFDERGPVGSRALAREKLKQIIDKLPEAARGQLTSMYENG